MPRTTKTRAPLQIPEELEIGCDESGRGPLLGRVYAAAVILDPLKPIPSGLDDSKKLTHKTRAALRTWIEKEALAWGVGFAEPQEIDACNILKATHKAMHRAIHIVKDSCPSILRILVDGDRFTPCEGYTHRCLPKADATWAHVAAASILAKEYHDAYIRGLCEADPSLDEKYGILSNMGYPTARHLQGLMEHGPSEHHRRTFSRVQSRPIQ